jgi:hypothetical protein
MPTGVNAGDDGSTASERQIKRTVYAAIADVAMPGDVIFIITVGHRFSRFQKIWRSWLGIDQSSKWHTTIYTGMRKERNGSTFRPYIVHSAEQGFRHAGTIEEHITPGYYTSRGEPFTVLEILSHRGLDSSGRQKVVAYARSRIGTPHDGRGWQRDFLTYVFGLPAVADREKVSCHALAYEAYDAAGVGFAHQVGTMPWFNVARWRGRPLGQPPKTVDVNTVYLRDHHLYNDPRFEVVLSVSRMERELTLLRNPGKYSWLDSGSGWAPLHRAEPSGRHCAVFGDGATEPHVRHSLSSARRTHR